MNDPALVSRLGRDIAATFAANGLRYSQAEAERDAASYLTLTRPLLSPTDPRYLRRLVRELNGLPDGFYLSSGARYSRTRYSKGRFQVYIPLPGVRAAWHDLAPGEHFRDAYGRTVTASRTP